MNRVRRAKQLRKAGLKDFGSCSHKPPCPGPGSLGTFCTVERAPGRQGHARITSQQVLRRGAGSPQRSFTHPFSW